MKFTKVAIVMAWMGTALLLHGPARAQTYPSQNIHVIGAFPPGSGSDIIVRFFAEKLRPFADKPIIVESKPGANGKIATEYTARSKPDGHTLFIHAGNALASNSLLIKNNPVDVVKQIAVAATINQQGFMVVVDSKSPVKTVPDLTDLLKKKGDKASFGSSSNQGLIAGSLLNEMGKFSAVFVNYRTSADSLNDLASGAIDYAIIDPAAALAMERNGRVRPIAVMLPQRLPFRPDIPTLTEFGFPIEIVGWFAAMVPAETPRPIVIQLNQCINQIIDTDEARKFMTDIGATPWISKPEDGKARLVADITTWRRYVDVAKLVPQ